MGVIEDSELFQQRPVTQDAILSLRNLCRDEWCLKIECLAVKCALEAYDSLTRDLATK